MGKDRRAQLSERDERQLETYREFMRFPPGEAVNGFLELRRQFAKLTSKGCDPELLLWEAMMYAADHAGEAIGREFRQSGPRTPTEKRTQSALRSAVGFSQGVRDLAACLDSATARAPHLGLLAKGVQAYLGMARVWLMGLQRVAELLSSHVVQVLGSAESKDRKDDKRAHLVKLIDHMQAVGVTQWRIPAACLVSCWEPSNVWIVESSEQQSKRALCEDGEPLRRRADELAAEYKRAKAALGATDAKPNELP